MPPALLCVRRAAARPDLVVFLTPAPTEQRKLAALVAWRKSQGDQQKQGAKHKAKKQ